MTALRLREAVRSGICLGHMAVMQGAVRQAMGLDEMLAQVASAYGVASGVTAAAVRLGAIGALEGQKILRGCFPLIEILVAEPVAEDAELSRHAKAFKARHVVERCPSKDHRRPRDLQCLRRWDTCHLRTGS